MSTRVEQSMGIVGVMTLAATVGAVAALLFAPRKGSETRERIRSRLQEAKSRSHEAMDAANTKTQEGVNKLKSKVERTADDTSSMVTEARSQVEDTVAEAVPKTTGRRPSSSA